MALPADAAAQIDLLRRPGRLGALYALSALLDLHHLGQAASGGQRASADVHPLGAVRADARSRSATSSARARATASAAWATCARLFRNSFAAAFFSALLAVVLGAMAAYALSRFRYRRWKNNDIAFWFISQRMMPPIALVVPYFILFGRVGLLDRIPVADRRLHRDEPAAGHLAAARLLPGSAHRDRGGVDGRRLVAIRGVLPHRAAAGRSRASSSPFSSPSSSPGTSSSSASP